MTPAIQVFLNACEEAGVDNLGTGLIEVKNTSGWNMKYWKGDDSPEHYRVQVQCQLYVSGLKWAVLCPKIGSADIMPKLILPKPEFHLRLEEEVAKFWKEVSDDQEAYIK